MIRPKNNYVYNVYYIKLAHNIIRKRYYLEKKLNEIGPALHCYLVLFDIKKHGRNMSRLNPAVM